jgi:Tol biopolymer transport system component
VAPLLSVDGSWAAAWTRDGRSLIYESGRNLWRVSGVGDSAPERLELAGYGALSPALAANRDRLAFVSQRNTITQHPLDTTYTSPPVLASSYWDMAVDFSHDGQRLVFCSSRGGEGMEIWTARADGTGARQLTRGPGRWQGSPSFSPDGRQVVFNSQHEDGTWSLFLVDADGGVPRQLTTDPGDEDAPVCVTRRPLDLLHVAPEGRAERLADPRGRRPLRAVDHGGIGLWRQGVSRWA